MSRERHSTATAVPRSVGLLLVGLLVGIACQQPAAEEEEPAARRLENAELGVAVAALPEVFEVESADGDTIRLFSRSASGTGRLVIAADPPQRHGVNSLDAAKAQKEHYEALPEGEFHGNQELMAPMGTAITARGSYASEEGRVEELKVFMVHPAGNRQLHITYRYPAGEGGERAPHVVELLGEMEALSAEPTEPAP